MITLSYKHINDTDFNDAIEIIDRTNTLSVKTMCAFNRFKKTYDTEKARARELFNKIIEKYTEMETVSEGDKIVQKPKTKLVDGQTQRSFTDPAAMDLEVKELLEETFDVQVHPIPMNDLGACRLSPKQVRALAPILVDEEDAKAGPQLVKNR